MEAPRIGITTYGRDEQGRFCLPAAYVDAVRRAGGVPLLLPPGEERPERVLEVVDGLILAGGGDIDPASYGGQSHPTLYLVDPERDRFELHLARAVVDRSVPVLGICRGSQVLNVAWGGDLVPHLPEDEDATVRHRLPPRIPTDHPVRVDPGSRLAGILGEPEVSVRSWHHQAVRRVAPGWRAVAWAPDGTVEAVEWQQDAWAVGVQWHPELSLDSPVHRRLFEALVQAAARRRAER
ncbi:MAG: gamma-glutamyl-gamma-aminobutyrate hydrolase family protein [bacterium]